MKSAARAVFIGILFQGCLSGQTGRLDPKLPNMTPRVLNGEFVGMEEMKGYEPGKKWFHENSLLIKNDEAVLDKVPVEIVKGKKEYSASDGGFITYRGRFFRRDGKLFISLRPILSDYIIFPTGGCEPYSKITTFSVDVSVRGVEIDGVLYHVATLPKDTRYNLSRMLRNEALEYTGAHPYDSKHKRPPCQ